jgi:hypothetical protein
MNTVLSKKFFYSLSSLSLLLSLSAPAQSIGRATEELSSLAQDLAFENNVGELNQFQLDEIYFVSTENLSVRETEATNSALMGKLYFDDQVKITDLTKTALIGVQIKKSSTFREAVHNQKTYFVGRRFLTKNSIMAKKSDFFVIQNIATEMTRVYKRCKLSPSCPHQMVFEAKMVVGRPEEGTDTNDNAFKTRLGHSKLSEWVKFYSDGSGKYLPWYSKNQPISSIPPQAPKDSNGRPNGGPLWAKKWRKEQGEEIKSYGAFGWYAGKLHPASGRNGVDYQWLHGTIGWGADGDAVIDLTRGTLINMFGNPGSAGCTRLSNISIAYLRHLLPAGTDIYRVYAREATRLDPCLSTSFWGSCREERVFPQYAQQYSPLPWDFTLLTDDPQISGGVTSDTRTLLAKGYLIRQDVNVIEQGTHYIDQYPSITVADYNFEPSSGKTGDRYMIDDPTREQPTQFRGAFIIDEGRFVDYEHPKSSKVVIGGLQEFQTKMPAELQTDGSFVQAKIIERRSNNTGNVN